MVKNLDPPPTGDWSDTARQRNPEHWWLLHAAAAGPNALAPLAKALQRPWRHIDLPALVAAPDDTAPVKTYAAAVSDQLEERTGRTYLFGHSMGGLVALLAALRGARPTVLILYEPIVVSLLDPSDGHDVAAHRWDAEIVEFLQKAVAEGAPEAGVSRFIEAWNETPWSGLPEAARRQLVESAALLARETRATSSFTLQPAELAALNVPTAILQGERSPAITHRMSARLAALLPNARTVPVDGAGHMGPMLNAARVAGIIEQALPYD